MKGMEDALAAYRDWFKVEGKSYRMFKREKSKDAPWYVYFERRGRRFLRCLETNQKPAAIVRGKAIVEAVRNESWAELEGSKSRRPVASIGDVLAAYERIGARRPDLWRAKTVAGNVSALKGILRPVFGDGADVLGLSTAVLDRDVVRRFKEHLTAKSAEDAKGGGDLDLERRMRTGNSYLGQGRSLFARHVLELYEAEGLRLPDLRGFMEAGGFRRVRKREYNAPSSALIAETFRRLDDLRAADRNGYLAVCLAFGTGMRKGEIARARWDWFVTRRIDQRSSSGDEEQKGTKGTKGPEERVFLRSDCIDKKGMVMDLPVLAEWWARVAVLRPAGWEAVEEPYVLEGSKTERTEDVFRRIGVWMRGIGWQTQKAIHEFRAYVISKIAEVHGIEAASTFARHEELRTTKQSYMRYVKMGCVDVKLVPG